jgi:hypothetical protein
MRPPTPIPGLNITIPTRTNKDIKKNKSTLSWHRGHLILIVLIPTSSLLCRSIFTDRNLDTLSSKALAQMCAFHHTREFLGRVDGENVRKASGKNWGATSVENGSLVGWGTVRGQARRSNVDKGKTKTAQLSVSIKHSRVNILPEVSLSADGKVL